MGVKKKLAILACSAVLVGAGMGTGFADTYKTIDGQVLTTPIGVTVFSAKEVLTKDGAKNLFLPEMIEAMNRGIEKGINDAGKRGAFKKIYNQELANKDKENKPLTSPTPKEFTEFKGDLIKDINFQELKGTDVDGHHVAYIFELSMNGESFNSLFKSMGVGESYNYSNLTEKDVIQKEAKKAKKLSKVDIDKLNQQIREIQIKALEEEQIRLPNGQTRLLTDTEKAMWKKIYNLISYDLRDVNAYGNVESKVGDLSYFEERIATNIESMTYPMSIIGLVEYKPEGPSTTLMVMNDNSFDYWKQQVAAIWDLKK